MESVRWTSGYQSYDKLPCIQIVVIVPETI